MYARQITAKQRVVMAGGSADLAIHLVGPQPVLRHFIAKLTLDRIINSCLGTARETLLDHGQTLTLLIQNILLSPAPLYRIAAWAGDIDATALGLSEIQKKALNDDRIARSLEALASSRGRSIFFRLALRAIKEFEIDVDRIHNDTTTVTFFGRYPGSIAEPIITHGHNKDHRPDLKQLVFGLNVTADGAVPLLHTVHSGNKSDDSLHVNNVEQLRALIGRDDFIYVADSKLCTKKNLGHISAYGGRFVTVLPKTFGEDKAFRDRLRQSDQRLRWKKLLETKATTNHNDTYWTTSIGPEVTSDGYRLCWFRSSQKMALDAAAREAAIEKALAGLSHLSIHINKGKYRKLATIQQAVRDIVKGYGVEAFIDIAIESHHQRHAKRQRKGRPRKGDPVEWITGIAFELNVSRNEEKITAEARTDGVFPLVTNLPEAGYPKKEVLLIYKYQPHVEKRHALFKGELGIAPVYLKKPSRVVGLVHATFLAMTVDALIERTVRRNMKKRRIDALPILPEGRETSTPTTARILEAFSGLSWYEFKRGNDGVCFPIKLTPIQRLLLELLDMKTTAYT